jgi:O-antigen ligase/Tfp pilus assembly protein PilF
LGSEFVGELEHKDKISMSGKKMFLVPSAITLFLIGFWSHDLFSLLLLLTFPVLFILYRSKIKTEGNEITLGDIAVIGVMLYELLVYPNTLNPYNSLSYLFLIWNLFIYYFLIRFILLKEIKRDAVILFVAAGGLLLSLLTCFQYLAFSFSISAEGFDELNNFKHLYKPFGIFSNEWATVMLLILPFSVASYFVLRSSESARAYSWVSAIILLFNIFTILISFSRGAYISLILFFILTAVFVLVFQVLKTRDIVRCSAGFLALIALSIIPIEDPVLTTASLVKTESQQRSLESRKNIWQNALTAAGESNFLGVGSNNFALAYSKVYDAGEDQAFTQRASNVILKLWIEKGYSGLVVYGAFFFLFFFSNGLRLRSKGEANQKIVTIILCTGILAMLVRDLSFSSIFENTTILFLATTIFALCPGKPFQTSFSRRSKLVAILGVSSVWIGLTSMAGLQWMSTHYFETSLEQLKRNELKAAHASVNQAIRLCSSNPQYFSHKGIIEYRLAVVSGSLLSPTVERGQYIIDAFSSYESALKMNPADASFIHNLGWLCLLTKDTAQAKMHFINAANADRNCSLYRISLGMVSALTGDSLKALHQYQEAIRMNPEILDSKFYSEFRSRFPNQSTDIVRRILSELNELPTNSIVQAKLGKLYLSAGEIEKSSIILVDVSQKLPSLNRVWYHLGIIKETKGDSLGARKMYLRSSFLDPQDFLPALKLADYYYYNEKKSTALAYYKQVLKSRLTVRSEHAIMVNSIYGVPGNGNDIISQELLSYLKPYIDVNEVCFKIASCYASSNNNNMCRYYTNISRRNELFLSDIK